MPYRLFIIFLRLFQYLMMGSIHLHPLFLQTHYYFHYFHAFNKISISFILSGFPFRYLKLDYWKVHFALFILALSNSNARFDRLLPSKLSFRLFFAVFSLIA